MLFKSEEKGLQIILTVNIVYRVHCNLQINRIS